VLVLASVRPLGLFRQAGSVSAGRVCFGRLVEGNAWVGVGWSGTLLGPEGTGVVPFLRPVWWPVRAGLSVEPSAWTFLMGGCVGRRRWMGLVSVRSLRTA
jgi:hypothetical protein